MCNTAGLNACLAGSIMRHDDVPIMCVDSRIRKRQSRKRQSERRSPAAAPPRPPEAPHVHETAPLDPLEGRLIGCGYRNMINCQRLILSPLCRHALQGSATSRSCRHLCPAWRRHECRAVLRYLPLRVPLPPPPAHPARVEASGRLRCPHILTCPQSVATGSCRC
jgi:hypothetical protein